MKFTASPWTFSPPPSRNFAFIRRMPGRSIKTWWRRAWSVSPLPRNLIFGRKALAEQSLLLSGPRWNHIRNHAAAGELIFCPSGKGGIMHQDTIRVIDAVQNNLKHISVEIPKHAITVVTGVSGSGKSSLVLDTIAAQSRRELNETFPQFYPAVSAQIRSAPCGADPQFASGHRDRSEQAVRSGAFYRGYLYRHLFLTAFALFRVGQPFVGYSDSFSFNHPQGRCPRCDMVGRNYGAGCA